MKALFMLLSLSLAGCATYEKCGPQDKSDYCEGLRRGHTQPIPPKMVTPDHPSILNSPTDHEGNPVMLNPHYDPVNP